MKRLAFILLVLSVPLKLAAQTDSVSRFSSLDSLLVRFYDTLQPEENSVKGREFDNLIAMCHDSLTRQHVTMQVFDHYSHSRVMGEEAVAIHVYDEWIGSGKVKCRSEFEDMEKQIFAEFNRHSLVGMQAPPVRLYKPNGATLTVPEKGRTAVLFFYATDCMKCKLEWEVLPSVLSHIDMPVNFYAVNFSSDRKMWKKYRRSLKVRNRNVTVKHLWDPDVESDYQRMYGVTATPRMFVVLEDGEIFGRRLELENLQEIFHYIGIGYGNKENQGK